MKINTRKIAFIPVAMLAAGLAAACGGKDGGSTTTNSGGNHGTSTEGAHAKAEASALKNSATTKLTEAEAKTLAAQCLPGDATSSPSQILTDLIFHPSKRHAALECAKIPRSNWQAAANCLIAQHKANPIPKASDTVAEKQAQHQAVVRTFAPCVLKYHEGATATPSSVPSPAGAPATATPSKAKASAKASS